MNGNGVPLLLVEDDAVDAEALQRAFRRQRVPNPLAVVRDGVEALAALRGESGVGLTHPCIVLLDLNMPRMNGIEFLAELRADPALSSTVVFMLTTSDREEDTAAAYRHHVAGYIVKSRAGEDYREVIELLRAYSRLVAFPPPPGAAP